MPPQSKFLVVVNVFVFSKPIYSLMMRRGYIFQRLTKELSQAGRQTKKKIILRTTLVTSKQNTNCRCQRIFKVQTGSHEKLTTTTTLVTSFQTQHKLSVMGKANESKVNKKKETQSSCQCQHRTSRGLLRSLQVVGPGFEAVALCGTNLLAMGQRLSHNWQSGRFKLTRFAVRIRSVI